MSFGFIKLKLSKSAIGRDIKRGFIDIYLECGEIFPERNIVS